MRAQMKWFLHSLLTVALLANSACGPMPSMGKKQPQEQQTSRHPVTPQAIEQAAKDAETPNAPVVKVAILLPLSGDSAKLGNAMLDAAMLALYDKYLSLPAAQQTAKLVLIPKDTGSSPLMAESAVREALAEGVQLILGPLFSQSVTAVAPLAKARGVNIITFSNNTAIAGQGVYVFGFIPTQQVERVASYASLQGIRRFAALGPNDVYGQSVTSRFLDVVTKRGGISKGVELYAPRSANLDAAVGRLAHNDNSADSTSRLEALFIAEGGAQLKNIFDTLRKHQVDRHKIRLIGTGLWDEADVTTSPDLIGGWFASSPPETVQWFEKRFLASYGYKPQRLAGIAYDAVALASALALSPAGPGFTSSMITDPRGYFGPANGAFRFHPDGTSERALAVMEVTSSGFKTLEAAPRSF